MYTHPSITHWCAHSCTHCIYCHACICIHHIHSHGCLHIEACATHMHMCHTYMCVMHMCLGMYLHMLHSTFINFCVYQSPSKQHTCTMYTCLCIHMSSCTYLPHMHATYTHRRITYLVHTHRACTVTQAMCTLLPLRHCTPLLPATQLIHLWRKSEF